MDTIGGPLLTCGQKSAGTVSEDRKEQNVDKGFFYGVVVAD